MSYFARPDMEQEKHRGKATQRVLSPSRLHRGPTREEYLEEQVKAYSSREPAGENFLTKNLERSEAPIQGKSSQGVYSARGRKSDIFGAPKLDEQPKRRVRDDVSVEQLQKIHVVSTVKEEAAAKMNAAPTLVDKMYMCQYPVPHSQEIYKPEKKRVNMPHEEYSESEVPGFSGLGVRSKPDRSVGLATRAPEPYIPELPTRKPPALRHRNASIYNPLNGERSAWYGQMKQQSQQQQ